MPKVPAYGPAPNVQPIVPISDTTMAMAAAMMTHEGLLAPAPLGPEQHFQKTPNQRVKEGFEDVGPGFDWMELNFGPDKFRWNTKKGLTKSTVV